MPRLLPIAMLVCMGLLGCDLIPSFGTKLSMIFSERKGKRNVEEQAHGSADHCSAETSGGRADGRRNRPREWRIEAHDLRLESEVRRDGCEPGAACIYQVLLHLSGQRDRPTETHCSEPEEIADEPRERYAFQVTPCQFGRLDHFVEFVLSIAARKPFANFAASSFAQKCMKNKRGSSVSMWLCRAVTAIPF